jgi:hypothetical protein
MEALLETVIEKLAHSNRHLRQVRLLLISQLIAMNVE